MSVTKRTLCMSFLAAAAAEKRRRLVLLALESLETQAPGPQGPKAKVLRFDWQTYIETVNSKVFRRAYRVDIDGFYVLLDLVYDDIQTADLEQARTAAVAGSRPRFVSQ